MENLTPSGVKHIYDEERRQIKLLLGRYIKEKDIDDALGKVDVFTVNVWFWASKLNIPIESADTVLVVAEILAIAHALGFIGVENPRR